MSDSKKANEEMLNALHNMTCVKIVKLLKEAEGDPELMLKVLREARGFLKDNEVTAYIAPNSTLPKQVEAVTKVEELPFTVSDVEEE